MQTRSLTPDFAVSGQIKLEDVAEIAAAGFRSIICNRPDGEAPDQTDYADIAAAAEAAGLPIRYIPVYHSGITPENVEALSASLAELPAPIFAYCRSGARSGTLYGLATQRA